MNNCRRVSEDKEFFIFKRGKKVILHKYMVRDEEEGSTSCLLDVPMFTIPKYDSNGNIVLPEEKDFILPITLEDKLITTNDINLNNLKNVLKTPELFNFEEFKFASTVDRKYTLLGMRLAEIVGAKPSLLLPSVFGKSFKIGGLIADIDTHFLKFLVDKVLDIEILEKLKNHRSERMKATTHDPITNYTDSDLENVANQIIAFKNRKKDGIFGTADIMSTADMSKTDGISAEISLLEITPRMLKQMRASNIDDKFKKYDSGLLKIAQEESLSGLTFYNKKEGVVYRTFPESVLSAMQGMSPANRQEIIKSYEDFNTMTTESVSGIDYSNLDLAPVSLINKTFTVFKTVISINFKLPSGTSVKVFLEPINGYVVYASNVVTIKGAITKKLVTPFSEINKTSYLNVAETFIRNDVRDAFLKLSDETENYSDVLLPGRTAGSPLLTGDNNSVDTLDGMLEAVEFFKNETVIPRAILDKIERPFIEETARVLEAILDYFYNPEMLRAAKSDNPTFAKDVEEMEANAKYSTSLKMSSVLKKQCTFEELMQHSNLKVRMQAQLDFMDTMKSLALNRELERLKESFARGYYSMTATLEKRGVDPIRTFYGNGVNRLVSVEVVGFRAMLPDGSFYMLEVPNLLQIVKRFNFNLKEKINVNSVLASGMAVSVRDVYHSEKHDDVFNVRAVPLEPESFYLNGRENFPTRLGGLIWNGTSSGFIENIADDIGEVDRTLSDSYVLLGPGKRVLTSRLRRCLIWYYNGSKNSNDLTEAEHSRWACVKVLGETWGNYFYDKYLKYLDEMYQGFFRVLDTGNSSSTYNNMTSVGFMDRDFSITTNSDLHKRNQALFNRFVSSGGVMLEDLLIEKYMEQGFSESKAIALAKEEMSATNISTIEKVHSDEHGVLSEYLYKALGLLVAELFINQTTERPLLSFIQESLISSRFPADNACQHDFMQAMRVVNIHFRNYYREYNLLLSKYELIEKINETNKTLLFKEAPYQTAIILNGQIGLEGYRFENTKEITNEYQWSPDYVGVLEGEDFILPESWVQEVSESKVEEIVLLATNAKKTAVGHKAFIASDSQESEQFKVLMVDTLLRKSVSKDNWDGDVESVNITLTEEDLVFRKVLMLRDRDLTSEYLSDKLAFRVNGKIYKSTRKGFYYPFGSNVTGYSNFEEIRRMRDADSKNVEVEEDFE